MHCGVRTKAKCGGFSLRRSRGGCERLRSGWRLFLAIVRGQRATTITRRRQLQKQLQRQWQRRQSGGYSPTPPLPDQGKGWRVVLKRKGSSKSVRSPGFLLGMGWMRAERGLFHLTASEATSEKMRLSWSAE